MRLRLTTLLLLLGLMTAGAAHAGLKRLSPGDRVKLGPDQALVLLAVDTPLAVRSVRAGEVDHTLGTGTIKDLPAGRSFGLFVADAGRYQWVNVLPSLSFRFHLDDDEDFQFEVKPGVVNYPGDLIFYPRSAWRARFWLHNRGLRAIEWMEENFPDLIKQIPFHYSGRYPDPFADFYLAQRAQLGSAAAETAAPPELAEKTDGYRLPPELLWRQRELYDVTMSPDGRFVALQLQRGEEQWEIEMIDLQAQQRRLLARSIVPYQTVAWSGPNRLLLAAGEPWLTTIELIAIDPAADADHQYKVIRLPRKGILIDELPNEPDHILLGTHNRRGDLLIHRADMSSQASADALRTLPSNRLNVGVKNDRLWLTDGRGRLRLALVEGEESMQLMYGLDGEFNELPEIEDPQFDPLALSAEGDAIYGLSDRGRAQRDLVEVSVASGRIIRTLFTRPGVDVDALVMNPGRQPIGVTFMADGRRNTEYFATDQKQLQALLGKAFPNANVSLAEQSLDGSQQLLWVAGSDRPPQLYHLDRKAASAALLLDALPWLADQHFDPAVKLDVPVGEGLTIEAFLTLPQSEQPPPLVVFPHGGPVGVADSLRFDREVQFLSSQGYAVLQVNFRGSDGYGRAFREAGHRNFGTLIEDDIDAAIEYALAHHRLDAERMCMLGSSYGGYSALIASVRWPDRFRCAISIAGLSDRILHFSATDSTASAESRESLHQIMGDPREDPEGFRATSPVYRYQELTTPVLLIHGLDDRRVDAEHSFRLQKLLTMAGRPPSVLYFEHEGHGIGFEDNRLKMWRSVAAFLAEHLQTAAAEPGTTEGGTR
ncbi:MAG: S9 family peptidase [Xanthomonadales bacterium]|nr:S9 family peptidase [Xanthomonadales bacterium]